MKDRTYLIKIDDKHVEKRMPKKVVSLLWKINTNPKFLGAQYDTFFIKTLIVYLIGVKEIQNGVVIHVDIQDFMKGKFYIIHDVVHVFSGVWKYQI